LVAHIEGGLRLRVFQSSVLRRIFRPKRDEVTGDWRRLHNKELSDLYCSPSIVWVIESRRMRCAGNEARAREMYTEFWWGNLRERDHLEEPNVDGRIILRWIFRKWDGGGAWIGSSWLRIRTGGGHL
jgi:hypothetical protein